MVPAMFTSSSELMSRWEKLVGSEGSREIDVWPELENFTSDVISRTAFGSSFREGMKIFQLQKEQAQLFIKAANSVYFPGSWCIFLLSFSFSHSLGPLNVIWSSLLFLISYSSMIIWISYWLVISHAFFPDGFCCRKYLVLSFSSTWLIIYVG